MENYKRYLVETLAMNATDADLVPSGFEIVGYKVVPKGTRQ